MTAPTSGDFLAWARRTLGPSATAALIALPAAVLEQALQSPDTIEAVLGPRWREQWSNDETRHELLGRLLAHFDRVYFVGLSPLERQAAMNLYLPLMLWAWMTVRGADLARMSIDSWLLGRRVEGRQYIPGFGSLRMPEFPDNGRPELPLPADMTPEDVSTETRVIQWFQRNLGVFPHVTIERSQGSYDWTVRIQVEGFPPEAKGYGSDKVKRKALYSAAAGHRLWAPWWKWHLEQRGFDPRRVRDLIA